MKRRPRPIVAWIVILAVAAAIVTLHAVQPRARESTTEDPVGEVLVELQGRYLVGASLLLGHQIAFDEQARTLNTGTVAQRLRVVVLLGELSGPRDADDAIDRLDERMRSARVTPTDGQAAVLDALRRLYGDYEAEAFDAPSVTEENRRTLERELGWFGRLALTPKEGADAAARAAVVRPAKRTMIAAFVGIGLAGLAGLAGFVGLTVLLVLLLLGRLRGAPAGAALLGGFYAEAFAVWIVLFLGVQILVDLYVPEPYRMTSTGVVFLASLAALGWAGGCHAPWRQVREDIGHVAGRGLVREALVGVAVYAMTLPVLAIVLVGTIFALAGGGLVPHGDESYFGPTGGPAHPIVEFVVRGNWWGRIQVLLVAAVAAPIVEETMFRGVLYRHLREATARWGRAGSVVVSGLVAAALFAVLHPQGIVAVPALTTLAMSFTLMREWRGTLVPGMVAHGLNNGAVMVWLLLMAG